MIKSSQQNCVLLDQNLEPGDEPVKICVRDNEIVEVQKWLSTSFDFQGKSVDMFKFPHDMAHQIVAQTELYLDQGRRDEAYEETIRDVILTSPRCDMYPRIRRQHRLGWRSILLPTLDMPN